MINILTQWPTINQGETAADFAGRQRKYLEDVMNNVLFHTLINLSIMDKMINSAFRDTSDLTTEITNQIRNLPIGKKVIVLKKTKVRVTYT